jgi:siroheme synthase-like protein
VVSPEYLPEFASLPLKLVVRRFRLSDLQGKLLAFAATNDRAVNHRIGIAARQKGILANIADSAEECDFVVPARVTRGQVQIAVSSGGRKPRLSAELRRKLEQIL